jgi:tRNA threonylcarbamoyl adenosine modification protein (Sua5/YciO/YrdC/YwlC family)
MVYPTDSCFALGCHVGDKPAMERIRQIRSFGERHHLTLMCRDLAEAAIYARIDDRQYRVMKSALPGSYTFILRATREVPRRLLHEKRKTIGVRVPAHAVAHALLAELGEPLLSSTLLMPGEESALSDAREIRDRLQHRVDLVIDSGPCDIVPSTVVDMTGDVPLVTRVGKGDPELLGATAAA